MMFDLTNDRKSMKSLIGQKKKKKKISSHKDMIMHFSGFFFLCNVLWMCFAMKICGSCRSSQSPICNFYLGP